MFTLNKRWVYTQHAQMASHHNTCCTLSLQRVCFCQICKLHISIAQMSLWQRFHLTHTHTHTAELPEHVHWCRQITPSSSRCDWSVYRTTNTRGGREVVSGAGDVKPNWPFPPPDEFIPFFSLVTDLKSHGVNEAERTRPFHAERKWTFCAAAFKLADDVWVKL